MDPLWGAQTTARTPLALAFVAGNLAESGLMAIGAVPRQMMIGVALAPLVLGGLMLPMARLVGSDDIFGGTVLVVLCINAFVYALAFAKDAALVVDELVLPSQTLAALCAAATLAMPGGWDPGALARAAASHPFLTAALAAGTVWACVYAVLRPRARPLAAFATLEWFALGVVLCSCAALHRSDFSCVWPGPPLPETPLHSFAAGMAFFYMTFHAALFVLPSYGYIDAGGNVGDGLDDFLGVLESKCVVRGAPLWLIAGCLSLQGGAWILIYTRRLLTPPGVMLFLALGFSHVFLIELKRFAAGRARP
jgi:hypothetical protein